MLKRGQQATVLIFRMFIFVGALLPTPASAQDCGAIWNIHCDPVGPPHAPTLGHQWAQMLDQISTADSNGVKLTLNMTGTWAEAAFNDGHQDTIMVWISNGHGVGTHAHPEFKEGAVWNQSYTWANIPPDKVQQCIDDATAAVNNLVGADNNRSLDTPLSTHSVFGENGYFPDQFTHYLYGNPGHNYTCRIFLSDGRELTFITYAGLPVNSTNHLGYFVISLADMQAE